MEKEADEKLAFLDVLGLRRGDAYSLLTVSDVVDRISYCAFESKHSSTTETQKPKLERYGD